MSQIGAPCPDHLINTKHKPLVVDVRPRRATAPTSSAALQRGVVEFAHWYRDYYERTSTTRRGSSRSIRPGRASSSSPASASSRAARDAGRARFARDLYHRAIAVEDAADAARRLPLAQRGRGVRDRVLAARALQARAGAAAGRARRPGRADHRRRERDRPRHRAPARRARRPRRRRRPERRGRRRRSRTSSSPPTACGARSRSPST